MKTFTVRTTVAVAILAGAGLSGCASDLFYDNASYHQGFSSQPIYSQRYHDSTNAQGYYYDRNNPNRPYYSDRPYYYQSR